MKFIIHIGLPKTASTALQRYVFPKSNSSTLFVGKYLNNSSEKDIQQVFVEGCSNQSDVRLIAQQKIRLKFADKNADLIVLYSDEMLSVDTEDSTWQIKISRVMELLSGYQVEIMIVARNPIDAMFSMYVETYNVHKWSFEGFVETNQARIYDYGFMIKEIQRIDSNLKILFIKFEELIDKEDVAEYLQERIGIMSTYIGKLPISNNKTQTKTSYLSHGYSLIDFLRNLGIRGRIMRKVSYPLYRYTMRIAGRMWISPGVEVAKPSQEVIDKIKSDLEFSMREFYEFSSIDYR